MECQDNMQRIYLPSIIFSEILEIKDTEIYHQLTRVMRARLGQQVIFFDGKNLQDIVYSIIHIDKKSVSCKKEQVIEKFSELSWDISLYQGFPNKLSKLEFIVQKCCEVGYKKIVFTQWEHSQRFILWESKKQRIQKIAIEAVEQSGGNIVPKIEFLDSIFHNNISQWEENILNIFCHTQWNNSQQLSDIFFWKYTKINICVGPEGGFSDTEVSQFETHNFQKVNFWERILRCETVWLAIWFYISQQKK